MQEEGEEEWGEWEEGSRRAIPMDPDLDYLYGVSPVLNALAANKRAFSEIYVQEVRGQGQWGGRQRTGGMVDL